VKGYRVSYRGEAREKVRCQICWASCSLYKYSITYRALYIIINVIMINVAHYGLAVSLPGNPNAPRTQNPKTPKPQNPVGRNFKFGIKCEFLSGIKS
jgi:hypothetical protein